MKYLLMGKTETTWLLTITDISIFANPLNRLFNPLKTNFGVFRTDNSSRLENSWKLSKIEFDTQNLQTTQLSTTHHPVDFQI